MNAAVNGSPVPGWMRYAACAQIGDAVLPWTTDTHRLPTVLVEMMREVCDACPVRLACDAYATTEGVTGGFWAGMDRACETDEHARRGLHPGETVQLVLPFALAEPWGGAA